MEQALLPLPAKKEQAKALLDFIRYGIILTKAEGYPDRVEFYVKSPERLNMKDENGEKIDGRKTLIDFKRRMTELHKKDGNIILKRAPYKNEFDDWDESDSSTAYEEFKMWLMTKYSEDDLM